MKNRSPRPPHRRLPWFIYIEYVMLCVLVSFCLVNLVPSFVLFCFVLVHMRDRVCWSMANRILFDKFLFLFFMF